MGSYKIVLKKSVNKDLRKINRQELPKIINAVEALATNPFPTGSRKLTGSDLNYRIRIGDYRVIYAVFPSAHEIVIQRIRHRKDVYE